jgi:hypothetical protein
MDALGALHHIIRRGVEQRNIFSDDSDGVGLVDRPAKLPVETATPCFACGLIPT